MNISIEEMPREIARLEDENELLQDRIDKAIEYIEDNSDDMHTYISQVLTDILKGSEQE